MVKVCDAIMGTGKSSAAITYMNEHPDRKFIYITPYLDEAQRIAENCPALDFVEPQRISEFSGSKTLHTVELVKRGRNIATTHQAFKAYTRELLSMIRSQHYILIIDENVDVLNGVEIDAGDFQMAVDAKYVEKTPDSTYRLADGADYDGKIFGDIFRMLKTRDIISVESRKKEIHFYWQFPPDLVMSFDEVFILTYLFEGQSLHCFLQMYDIPYQKIGISYSDGIFRFSNTENYIPPYVKTLGDKIHLVENHKINNIGDEKTALSMSWFKKNKDEVAQLKNNLVNFFRHLTESDASERMWSTYAEDRHTLRGKGYTSGFISFNTKATNKFKNKTVLAYCVNIYMNVGHKLIYQRYGAEVDEDKYALSIMVQWIWRSAIRDGKEIYLYIPSRRMRTIFKNWINEISKGE